MKKHNISELETLGLQALKDFWGLKNGIVETMTKDQVTVLIKKAHLGMQFFKEVNVNKRAVEHNTLRVCTMLANDKTELENLLRASLPQYALSKE